MMACFLPYPAAPMIDTAQRIKSPVTRSTGRDMAASLGKWHWINYSSLPVSGRRSSAQVTAG
jgi:hypothetical protein